MDENRTKRKELQTDFAARKKSAHGCTNAKEKEKEKKADNKKNENNQHFKIPILYENWENKQMIKYFDLYKNISKIIHGQLAPYFNKSAINGIALRNKS